MYRISEPGSPTHPLVVEYNPLHQSNVPLIAIHPQLLILNIDVKHKWCKDHVLHGYTTANTCTCMVNTMIYNKLYKDRVCINIDLFHVILTKLFQEWNALCENVWLFDNKYRITAHVYLNRIHTILLMDLFKYMNYHARRTLYTL